MFRLFALFCFTAVFTFSAVFAQDEPGTTKIKATPEILSLFEESLQSLSQAETNPRIGGLFQLLGFAVSFDDKAPAQKIVDTLLALAPSIEPEELRHHLYMGIANTFCDMEKYPEAIAVLDRISSPDVRRASQVEMPPSFSDQRTRHRNHLILPSYFVRQSAEPLMRRTPSLKEWLALFWGENSPDRAN